jgi:chromosome segregation ATPase
VRPEGDHAPGGQPPQEGERGTLAERRARRAWLGDAALLRRAEAAEATVRTLEGHIADLRRRQTEVEQERERTASQLAERDLELRRVKQREYAEQQLRVEAEEAAMRLRRVHRTDLDRLQRRAEEARAAAQHAEEQRDVLAARLAGVGESCVRLQRSVETLQSAAAGLRVMLEHDRRADQARIRTLEGELERALAPAVPAVEAGIPPAAVEAARREEMAGALAAAVERLRARVGVVEQQPESEQALEESPALPEESPSPPEEAPAAVEQPAPAPPAPEIPTVYVVPRLFRSQERRAPLLAPAIRRVAGRLLEWADRAQERSR